MYNTCDNYIVAFCITHPHHTGISFLVYCHFFWSSFSLPFGCLVSFHQNEYGSVRKFVRNRLHWARAVHSEWSTCVCVCVWSFFSVWFGSTIILRYTDLMHTPKSSIYLYQRAQVLVLDRAWLTYISSVVVSCFFFIKKYTQSLHNFQSLSIIFKLFIDDVTVWLCD